MSGETVLHAAAREGDLKILTQALKSSRDVKYAPALHHALSRLQSDLSFALHSSATDADGMTALHYAAWYGFASGCLALIAAGALVNKFDNDGATALHAAAFNGQLACVVALVDEGASVLITDNDNYTPADQADREKHEDISSFLRAMGLFDLQLGIQKFSLTTSRGRAEVCR